MSELVIRPVRDGDRSEWQELWAQYNAFYGREGETALTIGIVDTTWNRLLDVGEAVHGLVAEQDGVLIGLAHFVFHRNLIRIPETCYIQDLFTAEATRGLGVGRKLIDAVGRACQARGVVDLYWHTHSSNAAARALYDRVATNTDFIVYRRSLE